jgi:anti-sigma factor RsiW
MKECREVEPLKAPYVDGEAGAGERSAVDSHLARCGRCRDEVANERAARDVLVARRAELRASAPEHLKARCAAHATHEATAVSPPRARDAATPIRPPLPIYRRWVPMSLAATLVLAIAGVFGFGLTEKSQALAFQMTIDHVKCARFAGPAGHVDAGVEEQRWAATYGWPLRVPRSKSEATPESPIRLRGLRRCVVTDGRVAHLIYDWDGQPVSVYVLPSDQLDRAAEVERFGHDAIMWSQNGRTYVVLARSNRRPEFDPVVQYVKANVY